MTGPDSGIPLIDPDGGTPDAGDGGGGPIDDGVRHWPPDRTGYVNPIAGENQLAGDFSWNRGFTNPYAGHMIEGYADRVSAKAGD
ncbi:MAG: hypothetical protein ACJ78T_15370, partial [Myxococcales bacterium]